VTYAFNTTSNSTPTVINNFDVSQDKLDFSAIAGLNSTTQPVTMNFLSSNPDKITAHTIDIVSIGGNTVVYANASGFMEKTAAVDIHINLTGVSNLNSSDFIFHH
jgi:hypothetical protein